MGESKCVVLGLSTTQALLESEAEHLQVAKIQRNGAGKGILDTFSSEDRDLFVRKDKDRDDGSVPTNGFGIYCAHGDEDIFRKEGWGER